MPASRSSATKSARRRAHLLDDFIDGGRWSPSVRPVRQRVIPGQKTVMALPVSKGLLDVFDASDLRKRIPDEGRVQKEKTTTPHLIAHTSGAQGIYAST